jgi:hypothetical protein
MELAQMQKNALQYTHANAITQGNRKGNIMTKQQHYEAAQKSYDLMMAARNTTDMEAAAANYAFHMSRANAA